HSALFMHAWKQQLLNQAACACIVLTGVVSPAIAQETNTATSQSAAQTNGAAQQPLRLDGKWLSEFQWRAIGPAGMGGRITDFAVVESDPTTYWVATAGGGLLKTTNN